MAEVPPAKLRASAMRHVTVAVRCRAVVKKVIATQGFKVHLNKFHSNFLTSIHFFPAHIFPYPNSRFKLNLARHRTDSRRSPKPKIARSLDFARGAAQTFNNRRRAVNSTSRRAFHLYDTCREQHSNRLLYRPSFSARPSLRKTRTAPTGKWRLSRRVNNCLFNSIWR